MKKKMAVILLLLQIVVVLTACQKIKDNPIVLKDNGSTRERDFNYKIEKVTLSKSYQNVEPSIDLLKSSKDDEVHLSLNLGLMKSSGININKIEKNDTNIDIYVENTESTSEEIIIPQTTIILKGITRGEKEHLDYNIINTNYENYSVKYPLNDIISKVNTDFKVFTNTSPNVKVLEKDGDIIWNLSYINIFNNNYKESPVVDLDIEINGNTGKVIKSDKKLISNFIDSGEILDYNHDLSILYKKLNKEDKTEDLWLYDISKETKELVFTSNKHIENANINLANTHNFIIENSKDIDKNTIYILNLKDKKAYKTLLDKNINPSFAQWKNNNTIYILESLTETTNLYEFNLDTNETIFIKEINEVFNSFDEIGEYYLLTNSKLDKEDTHFYLTKDFMDYDLKLKGHKAKFLNDSMIGYLKYLENIDMNSFVIYDLENNNIYDEIDLNITNFISIDSNTLGLIEKGQNDSEYNLYSYNIKNMETKFIKHVNTDLIWHNKSLNRLYLNSKLPNKTDNPRIIYSIDLSEVYYN